MLSVELLFMKHLLCARQCAKCFLYFTHTLHDHPKKLVIIMPTKQMEKARLKIGKAGI